MQSVYIVSAVRTAIGGFQGALRDVPLPSLGAHVIREALGRARVEAGELDEVILGTVMQAGHEICPARVAALEAGVPEPVPAYSVNKACGSGLKAVALGAQSIRLGEAELVLAGGMESMNRVPYVLPRARTGYRMGHAELVDLLVHGLTCPLTHVHMGITAENVAERHGISRAEQDAFAAGSYEKALKAIAGGKFRAEIAPFPIPQKKGDPVLFDTDEDPVPTPLEKLASLRPAFKKDGTVTAGNSSNIDDGACAVLVASEARVRQQRLEPLARICGSASAGLEPSHMGLGPARAIPRLMARLGWSWDSVDLWELNEAFAAQSLGVLRELDRIDPERVNVNGGAVALGHPVGASGARILTTLIWALRDRGLQRGVASLCIGSGMGIAMGIELAG
jgi:acetyl-CoA C-acetyltransferase